MPISTSSSSVNQNSVLWKLLGDSQALDSGRAICKNSLTDMHLFELKGLFDSKDMDRDGRLSCEDIKELMQELGCTITDNFIQKIAAETTGGQTGITFEMFVAVLDDHYELLRNGTSEIDTILTSLSDEDGFVDVGKLRNLLTDPYAPNHLSKSQFDEFIKCASSSHGKMNEKRIPKEKIRSKMVFI